MTVRFSANPLPFPPLCDDLSNGGRKWTEWKAKSKELLIIYFYIYILININLLFHPFPQKGELRKIELSLSPVTTFYQNPPAPLKNVLGTVSSRSATFNKTQFFPARKVVFSPIKQRVRLFNVFYRPNTAAPLRLNCKTSSASRSQGASSSTTFILYRPRNYWTRKACWV